MIRESRGARFGLSVVRDARKRRIIYAVVAIVLAILCLFPQPHVARAKLLPQDTSSAGLGQILSQLGGQFSNFANLLTGGRPPNDFYLIVGRSNTVTNDVIGALKLADPQGPYGSLKDAKLALADKVDVHLLLGGVVEVETTSRDPEEALRLTSAYVQAISNRIASLTRQTTARKSQIVADRFREAEIRVGQAERALDAFRRANRLANPEAQLGSEISLRANLQGQLQAKQVELQTVQQFSGPENPALAAVQSQIATLRAQLARTGRPSQSASGPNISGLSELSSRYLNLFRDYRFAQALYDVYARSSEQVSVESLVAESATYIQVVEQANLDAERHFNIWAVALLALVVVIALFTEFYAPATGLTWQDFKGRASADDVPR